MASPFLTIHSSNNSRWPHPGWALIVIQSSSGLIQRFLRFQPCSELYQPTSVLTSLVITDLVMNFFEHLWFSAEHDWLAANRQRPWKQPKRCYFFIIDAERTRNGNFQNNFHWILLKNSKSVIFRKSVFPFDSMSENFLLEHKTVKNTKINTANGNKKRYRSWLRCFYSVFGRTCKVSAPSCKIS